MARALRLLLAIAAVAAAVAVGGATRARACGSNGYTYAGVAGPTYVSGISAIVTPIDAAVLEGHIAGYVDVGGPGEGRGSADEWLQVGLSGFPGILGSDVYYEVELPNGNPTYHQVAASVPLGAPVKLAVVEIHRRRNWWRVWLDGRAVSRPIHLPGSNDRWKPTATAESWDGGTGGTCNTFLYRFRRVSVVRAAGGGWHPLTGGSPISTSVTRVKRSWGGADFLAAEGRAAFRLLASLTP